MRYYTGIVMALVTVVSAAVCFAVSLEVGGRRDEVMTLKRQIASDMREVRRLQAEWQIRVRPMQLQRMNDTYFGLTAPTADRYFASAESYVAFAADPHSVPQKPQVLPAIEERIQPEAPRTYLAKATDTGEAQLVVLASGGPAVALQLPSESQIAAARQKQRTPTPTPGFGADAPKVHLASWSEDAPGSGRVQLASWSPEPAPAAPKPVVQQKPAAKPAEAKPAEVGPAPRAEVEVAMHTAEPAAAPYAAAIPQGTTPLSGLDPATIASIERLAAIEAGTR